MDTKFGTWQLEKQLLINKGLKTVTKASQSDTFQIYPIAYNF